MSDPIPADMSCTDRLTHRMNVLTLCALLGVVCCVAFRPASVLGQETVVRETAQRLEELKEQIARDEARLQTTAQEEQVNVRQLEDLNRQIAMREELVSVYARRVDELTVEEDSLQTVIQTMEQDVERLRDEYRKRASHAYRYGRQHDIALILSSESINQMLIRVGYLRRFSNERRSRLNALESTTQSLTTKRAELETRLIQSELMLGQADREQERLAELKNEREGEVRRLRNIRVDLTEELESKRTMARELSDRISDLIASAKPAPANAPARTFRLDAAALTALSASFRSARGRMSWPANGTVQEPFGELTNPVYGTKTPNPGILIATESAAEVRAVAAGRVSTVDVMPDIGSYIIVEHGEFHTVYGNFSLLYTQVGQMVDPGDILGRGGTPAESRGSAVFFGIFENAVPVNPVPWLSPR